MTRIVLALSLAFLLGCGSATIPPPYTPEELKQQCQRQGGWWRDDNLRGGFCEYQSGDMI